MAPTDNMNTAQSARNIETVTLRYHYQARFTVKRGDMVDEALILKVLNYPDIYLSQNRPSESVEDIVGKRLILEIESPFPEAVFESSEDEAYYLNSKEYRWLQKNWPLDGRIVFDDYLPLADIGNHRSVTKDSHLDDQNTRAVSEQVHQSFFEEARHSPSTQTEAPDLSWVDDLGNIGIELSGDLQDMAQELKRYIQSGGDVSLLNTESWIMTCQKMMETIRSAEGKWKANDTGTDSDQTNTIAAEAETTEASGQGTWIDPERLMSQMVDTESDSGYPEEGEDDIVDVTDYEEYLMPEKDTGDISLSAGSISMSSAKSVEVTQAEDAGEAAQQDDNKEDSNQKIAAMSPASEPDMKTAAVPSMSETTESNVSGANSGANEEEEVRPTGVAKLNQAELNRHRSAEKHDLEDVTDSVDIVIRDDMGEHEGNEIIGYYDKKKNEIGISRSLFERAKTDMDAAAELLCLITEEKFEAALHAKDIQMTNDGGDPVDYAAYLAQQSLLKQTRRSKIEFDARDKGELYTFKTTGEALKTAIQKVFTNERIQHNFSDGQRNFQVNPIQDKKGLEVYADEKSREEVKKMLANMFGDFWNLIKAVPWLAEDLASAMITKGMENGKNNWEATKKEANNIYDWFRSLGIELTGKAAETASRDRYINSDKLLSILRGQKSALDDEQFKSSPSFKNPSVELAKRIHELKEIETKMREAWKAQLQSRMQYPSDDSNDPVKKALDEWDDRFFQHHILKLKPLGDFVLQHRQAYKVLERIKDLQDKNPRKDQAPAKIVGRFVLDNKEFAELKVGNLSVQAFSGLRALGEGNKKDNDRFEYRNNPRKTDEPSNGPLPIGKYYIVDTFTQKQSDWFVLLYDDGNLFDDKTVINKVERSSFRLHHGTLSQGCITVESREEYNKISNYLTDQEYMTVPKTTVRTYGMLEVLTVYNFKNYTK